MSLNVNSRYASISLTRDSQGSCSLSTIATSTKTASTVQPLRESVIGAHTNSVFFWIKIWPPISPWIGQRFLTIALTIKTCANQTCHKNIRQIKPTMSSQGRNIILLLEKAKINCSFQISTWFQLDTFAIGLFRLIQLINTTWLSEEARDWSKWRWLIYFLQDYRSKICLQTTICGIWATLYLPSVSTTQKK